MSNSGQTWTHVCVATSATALLSSLSSLAGATPHTHVLKPGETLSAVARRFHVSIKDLKEANDLPDVDNVPDFKRLIIPAPLRKMHVEETLDRKAHVHGDEVSLRLGPDTSYRRIDLVGDGELLTVTSHHGEWTQVRLASGLSGWIRHDYLHEHGHPEVATTDRRSRSIASARRHASSSHHTSRDVDRSIARRHHDHRDEVAVHRHHRDHIEGGEGRHRQQVARHETSHPHHAGRVARTVHHHAIRLASAHHSHHEKSGWQNENYSNDIVRTAFAYRGTPYVYGGCGRGGFDCSGFTSYLYGKKGMSLPHSARAQYGMGRHVGRDNLHPGDLVFFHTVTPGISHVGMYVGNGRFVHASSRRSGGVRVDTLDSGYYSHAFRGGSHFSR